MKCDSSGVAPLKKDGISYSEPTDKVEIINEYPLSPFVIAFTEEDDILVLPWGTAQLTA